MAARVAARWQFALTVASLLFAAVPARGQRAVEVVADRAWLPPGAGTVLVAESGETLPRGEVAFAARWGLLGRPWVLRNALTGATVAVPVERAMMLEIAAAMGVTGRLQVGLAQPLTLYQTGDRLRGVAEDAALASTVGGDTRLHVKASILDAAAAGGRVTLAFAPFIAAPTGDAAQFAGVGSVWGEVRFAGGWRGRGVLLAADLGVRLRSPTSFYGVNQDTAALTFAAGASWTPGWRVLRERLALLVDLDGESYGPGRPVPCEGRAGARVRVWRGLTVAAAAGASLSREPGAPPWRALVEVRVGPVR